MQVEIGKRKDWGAWVAYPCTVSRGGGSKNGKSQDLALWTPIVVYAIWGYTDVGEQTSAKWSRPGRALTRILIRTHISNVTSSIIGHDSLRAPK